MVPKAKSTPQLPADVLKELQDSAAKMQDSIGAPSGDKITLTRNKTFKLPNSDKEGETLRVVIIKHVSLNQYYPGKFDSKNPVPPVCVAVSEQAKGLVPFKDVPSRQSDDCDSCKQNEWIDGKKACKNQYMLAVLAVDNQAEGEIMKLQVSPTGLKNYDKFVRKATSSGITVPHPISFICEISFDPKVDYPSLIFTEAGLNHDVAIAAGRRAEATKLLLTPPTFTVPVPKAA